MVFFVLALQMPSVWNLDSYRSREQKNLKTIGHRISSTREGQAIFSLQTSVTSVVLLNTLFFGKNIFVEVKGLVTALKRSMKCRQVEEK